MSENKPMTETKEQTEFLGGLFELEASLLAKFSDRKDKTDIKDVESIDERSRK
jgi:hypothetical protein